jgi:tetratricopeptide (TPR) repeat protein
LLSLVVDELARCYGTQQIIDDPQREDLVTSRGQQDDVTATAEALHNMGYNYHLKGQLRESIEAFEQSLALRSSLHASGDLNVAQTMLNLAISLYEAGENVRAKAILEDAMGALRRFLPAHHQLIATGI